MPIPRQLEILQDPPAQFIPCPVRDHLGRNFTDHTEYSSKHNKTYWMVFWASRENADGMYSYKLDANSANRSGFENSRYVGDVGTWAEVLPLWKKHCFHNHRKCAVHPGTCGTDGALCPSHPDQGSDLPWAPRAEGGPTDVKPRIKRETEDNTAGANIQPKRNKGVAGSTIVIKRRAPRARPPPSYTPAPASKDDSDSDVVTPGGAPLFDPDTPPASAVHPATSAASVAAAPDMSPSVSSVSSLSAGSHSTLGPVALEKGKGRARVEPDMESSASRPTTTRARAGKAPAVTDTFFVSAHGFIHHSSQAAFADVDKGPLRVVAGWDEAVRYGSEVAERRRGEFVAQASRAASTGMELDL
ncbi:hypothetical protein C8F04DRAFT_1248762 [Mycena alexandri]|uniref:Uncharacterized protein n=1 Tax=Mycena alexandri TaxID=1745969 RepID=A0AAD6TK55_9AGAR|nr:hypothetical protein C8F04DRAFT_1248762 [Mycena alexandri]